MDPTMVGLVLFGSMAGLGALAALALVFGPWWLGGADPESDQ